MPRSKHRVLWLVIALVTLLEGCSAKKTTREASKPPSPAAKSDDSRTAAATTRPAAVPEATAAERLPDPGAEDVAALMAKADEMLVVLSGRTLDAAQLEQRETGAAFLGQARTASSSGDAARAAVLAKKCLLLFEDLESQTR